MNLSNIRIVLVRPRNPNNIGAVARAMKNFGFSDLFVVSPHPPVWDEARTASVGADDIIQYAQVVATVAQAVSDRELVVGTVDPRRGGTLLPSELRDEISLKPLRVALLFGSEKSGLSRRDLSSCHRTMSIPTLASCPSMNLAQAVAVCCYALAGAEGAQKTSCVVRDDSSVATAGELEAFLEHAVDLLTEIEFLTERNQRTMTERLRSSLFRLNATPADVRLWRGILRKLKRKIRG